MLEKSRLQGIAGGNFFIFYSHLTDTGKYRVIKIAKTLNNNTIRCSNTRI